MIAARWDKKWEGDEIVLEGWCKGKEGWTEFLRQQYRLLKHGRSTVDGSARATFLSLIHEVRTIALYMGERFSSEFAINVPANVPFDAQRDFAILSLARSFVIRAIQLFSS